ncbi:SMP-30/gluconolactonase/LRE family protein [Ancylomarina sp. YFZ004]
MIRYPFILSMLLLLCSISMAQSYNNPESIVYDQVADKYFISNKSGNTIVQLNSDNKLTNFVISDLNAPKGLLIVGDTLISVNNTSVQGFLLSDASRVFNVSIKGAVFMNDVTSDNKGNLYVSDTSTGVIYQISLKTGEYSSLVSNLKNPNGLLFDCERNAVLICNWGQNAKIQSFNLTDSTLSDLVTTELSNLDGLAFDYAGNIYVSSWGSHAVYRFDSSFKNPPVLISEGHNGPADIFIIKDKKRLCIPNFNSNTIQFVNL